MYLLSEDLGKKNRIRNIQEYFHHEISHLLQPKYGSQFQKKEWKTISITNGITYFNGDPFRGFLGLEPEDNWLKLGFIVPYGQNNFSEDLATFYQFLMARPKTFKAAIMNHKKICQKAKLAVSFYTSLEINIEQEFKNLDCVKTIFDQSKLEGSF